MCCVTGAWAQESSISVTEVTPEPWMDAYNEAIPSQVQVTLDSEDFTVQKVTVTPNYLNAVELDASAWSVSGSVITINIPEEQQNCVNLTVNIYAVDGEGNKIVHNDFILGESIRLDYAIDPYTLVPETVEPGDFSEVESLSEIKLHFADNVAEISAYATANVIDENWITVAEGVSSIDPNDPKTVIVTITPALTEPGQYTVFIPEQAYYANEAHTQYNPELPYTYTVTGSGSEEPAEPVVVKDFNPAPYSSTDKYNDELPSTIELAMSGADFTVSKVEVASDYGEYTAIETYVVEDNMVTLNIDQSYITDHTALNVKIYATDNATGEAIVYGDMTKQCIRADYEIDPNASSSAYEPESVEPADGSEVASLYEIRLKFAATIGRVDNSLEVSVVDESGAPVATGTAKTDPWAMSDVIITLDKNITEPGTYTVNIPEGLVGKDYYMTETTPDLSYTYTVTGATVEVAKVESVDPEPCNEVGTYVDKMPATVTVTMSSEDFTVDQYGVKVQYDAGGGFMMSSMLQDYTVDGKTITINVPEKYQNMNLFMILIQAKASDGTPITYMNESQIVLTYETQVQAEVESVDPMPYFSGGDYSTELPTEITVTMSNENFTLDPDRGVVADVGGMLSPLDYTIVDGNKIVITVNPSVYNGASLTVMVYATSANGEPIVYNDELEQCIYLYYEVAPNTYVPVEVDPADGSTVEVLDQVRLVFAEGRTPLFFNEEYNENGNIVVNDESGETVATGTMSWDSGMGVDIIITLDKEIVKSGTYTLVIPERAFTPDYNYNTYNPELKYTFVVDGTADGISGIKVNADGTVKVYTLDGVYVGEGQASEVLGKLAKGIYIVNGTKVAVK